MTHGICNTFASALSEESGSDRSKPIAKTRVWDFRPAGFRGDCRVDLQSFGSAFRINFSAIVFCFSSPAPGISSVIMM